MKKLFLGLSRKAARDILFISLLGALLFLGALGFEVPRVLTEWTQQYNAGYIITLVIIVALGTALYSFRRWREISARDKRDTQSQDAGRDTEEWYRQFADTAYEGVWVLDNEHNTTFINTRVLEILGYTQEEVLGKSFFSFLDPEWQAGFEEKLCSPQSETKVQQEMKFRHRDGREVYAIATASSIRNNEGRSTGTLVMITDITDRRHIAEALRQSEEKFRSMFDNAGVGIVMMDPQGLHRESNPAMQEMTGFSNGELVGTSMPHKYWPERQVPFLSEAVNRVQREGHIEIESRFTRKEGDTFPVSIVASSVRDQRGECIALIWIVQDISEKNKIEDEHLKAEKLESVGVLAGGIAHDFNNILTGVMGYISLAKLYAKKNDGGLEFLEKAEKASFKAKALTQQLLTFSKGGAPVKKTAVIADVIKDSAEFALRGSNVCCEFSLPGDLWLADIDVGQISQVIQNLIINAQQAMPEGGIIRVRADNIENIATEALYGLPLDSQRYIKVSIQDPGVGIPTEYLAKIFDPYFTTKPRGSGLGLATTYSIIRRHGGHISVESKDGEGTTFHMYLPASDTQDLPDTFEEKKKAASGEGRVLVMDDEDLVREVAGKMLKALGYEVGFARDGSETIEVYEKAIQSGERFDVVIMDLTIPGGMGGEEAVSRLLAIDPRIKGIASSGYSTDPIMSDFTEYGFKGVIAKPYIIEELSKVIQEVLAEES